MKSLILIPLITAAFFAAAVALVMACGAKINPLNPMTAAGISIIAGILGILPIVSANRKDAVGIFQLALVGTVIHLVSAVALTAAAMFANIVAAKMGFMYWLLAGYWVSLILLLWQLRHRLLAAIELAKGPSEIKSATL